MNTSNTQNKPNFFPSIIILLSMALLFSACNSEGGELKILSIEPNSGPMMGNTNMKILGKGFRNDIGYTVYVGAERGKNVRVIDPTTLLLLTPAAQNAGIVDITVLADDGQAFKIAAGYTYKKASLQKKTPEATPQNALPY